MTSFKTIALAAALLGASAPAFAQSQLIANAGLTPAEAAGLSLNQIAVAKFNREARSGDRQVIVTPGSGGNATQLVAVAGLTPEQARSLSLNEIAVAKFNREADGDSRQVVVRRGTVTATTRSPGGVGRSQLIASAGLTAAEAQGLSLTEIAAAKFGRDTYN